MAKLADWRRKVQSLLNKAASTEFPEEADLLTAKATELMAKHAIEDWMLKEDKDAVTKITVENVSLVSVRVPSPYAMERIYIFQYVAKAMGADFFYTPVRKDGYKTATNDRNHDIVGTLVGFSADIDKVEMMVSSLMDQEQIARASAIAGMEFSRQGLKKVYVKSFIRGFAGRVGGRIAELYKEAAKMAAASGTPGVSLAVIDRTFAIRRKMADIGITSKLSSKKIDWLGTSDGRSAGDRAVIQGQVDH
ncbi:MAG: DUF2786 domain-containing protein [Nitrosopumilus sp.]